MNEKEKFNYYLSKLEDEGYFYDHFEYSNIYMHLKPLDCAVFTYEGDNPILQGSYIKIRANRDTKEYRIKAYVDFDVQHRHFSLPIEKVVALIEEIEEKTNDPSFDIKKIEVD